ncbi:MAG: DUF6320 domain-containing protein [Christensenellales bacterium]|jgi:hypothetical protein
MSYCVNCGVELDQSQKDCPLCGTEVINPKKPYSEKAERPYPKRLDRLNRNIDRTVTFVIITLVFIIAILTTLAANIVNNDAVTWSLYPVGAIILVWIYIATPWIIKKPSILLIGATYTISTLGYLALINLLVEGNWFIPLALPLVLSLSILVCSTLILSRKGIIRDLAVPAAWLIVISTYALITDIILNSYLKGEMLVTWSIFVLIPLAIMSAILNVIQRKKDLKSELKRRLHF